KLAYALDQVPVGFGRAGDQLAEARNDCGGMKVIEPIKQRHLAAGKLQAQKAAADLEHAIGLRESLVDVRNVANSKGDRVGIERLVGKGQAFGVADGIVSAVRKPGLDKALPPGCNHFGVDIAQHTRAARPARLKQAQADVAGAGGDIDELETSPLGWVEHSDKV